MVERDIYRVTLIFFGVCWGVGGGEERGRLDGWMDGLREGDGVGRRLVRKGDVDGGGWMFGCLERAGALRD